MKRAMVNSLFAGLLLVNAAGHERRPLSWVVGPQGGYRKDLPDMKEIKRPERQKQTDLAPQDTI